MHTLQKTRLNQAGLPANMTFQTSCRGMPLATRFPTLAAGIKTIKPPPCSSMTEEGKVSTIPVIAKK